MRQTSSLASSGCSLAHFRTEAAEILQTATTQRWPPEQLLRALLEAEVAGRDAANQANRLKAEGFPAQKTVEDFQVAASSVPAATDFGCDVRARRGRKQLRAARLLSQT